MIDDTTLEKWVAQYMNQRAAGAQGWTGGDSYRRKQGRITEALDEHSLPTAGTFLELGCGAGNITLWMASRGFAAFGVDIVSEAITWAKAKAEEAALTAQFDVANISKMTMFQDDYFDVIFDGDCFHMITGNERMTCFQEVHRILKQGGLLIAGGNVCDETVTEPVSLYGGTGSFTPPTKLLVTPDGLEYIVSTEDELCEELRQAGFTVMDVKHYPKNNPKRQAFIKESIAIHATK